MEKKGGGGGGGERTGSNGRALQSNNCSLLGAPLVL